MSKSKQGLMSACSWSIDAMQNLRKGLLDLGGKNQESKWAIGGIIIVLVSQLLMACHDILGTVGERENAKASDDLREIQRKFNALIDKMVESNEQI